MKKVSFVLGLAFLVVISCEDDDSSSSAASCETLMADLASQPFVEQLNSWDPFSGTLPDGWQTNCEAYQAAMQEVFDAGCYAAEDSVTQADIDSFSEMCDMEI